MNTDEILERIEKSWHDAVQADGGIVALLQKIRSGNGTYNEAQQLAIKTGNILASQFQKYLPEALIDGRLYLETAERLITRPILRNSRLLQDNVKLVQESMNRKAGLGLGAVVPDVNMDQVNGIVQGAAQAAQFSDIQEVFFDQVTNCLQGLVDDSVRENADFHYKAGLNPTIRRTPHGRCCPWCADIAGTYDYADVRDKGNDIYRRHRNCNCTVEYNPADGSGRFQNVHSKRWRDQTERAIRRVGKR